MIGGHGIVGIEREISGVDLVSARLADAERFIAELGERLPPPGA
jgi:hypothetical protein